MVDIKNEEVLRQRVIDLRSKGTTPKAIAKMLGVPQAEIRPIIRSIAVERAETEPDSVPVLCLVNAGWSSLLTLRDDRWSDVEAGPTVNGLVGVLIVRRDRRGRLSMCGYLVDVFCLGVKDVIGPRRIDEEDIRDFVALYFTPFGGDPIPMPIEHASELIHGAIDYARKLGFDPNRDFAAASSHLLAPTGECTIEFGREGQPFYVEGPRDNAKRIISTLQRTVGEGNFHFVASLPV